VFLICLGVRGGLLVIGDGLLVIFVLLNEGGREFFVFFFECVKVVWCWDGGVIV